MHNGLRGIPGEKIKDTSGLQETLLDKTSKISESLEKVVTDDFLTEEETKFFDELQNPDTMKENAKKIVSELCKRIYNGENPSRNLLDKICVDITGVMSGMYPGYIKSLLYKLTDWKGIAYLFQYNSNNSHDAVEEFRKKRKEYMNSKLNPMHASPDDSIHKEKPTSPVLKKGKTKVEYKSIPEIGYNESTDFEKAGDITDIPLLTKEDIAFATYVNSYDVLTKNTKVPTFDIRGHKTFNKYEYKGEIRQFGQTYCYYNRKDDISHVFIFCSARNSFSPGLQIAIKGKVSEKDANDLIKHLKEKYHFKIDPFSGSLVSTVDDSINRSNIQETIMEYFNSK